ncbi:MAG: modulator protein [Rhodobacteraceae bacterium]|nr:modulator protein [Paracoccaceae bacterium]
MLESTKTLSLEKLASELLSVAKENGAEFADVLVASGFSSSVSVRDGTLELSERSEGLDLGLRVFLGKRQAIVSGSDIRADTISKMVERAVAMAKEAPEDPYCGVASPEEFATAWEITDYDLCDPSDEPSAETLKTDALAVENAAMEYGGIKQVSDASASYSKSDIFLATSTGFSGGYAKTSRGLSCVAIAGTELGMERDYDYDSRVYGVDLRSADDIGSVAAERALARLEPRKPETGSFPVIFDQRVAASLIGHLLAASNGASVARGSSWLRDKLKEQVLPTDMSLLEEPMRPRIGASRPFDAEGLPKRNRVIVKDGILQGWTLDLSSARKLGVKSTGNAVRSPSSLPSPQVGNVTLSGGSKSRDELVVEMGSGLLVTSMIGSTVNPNTGDYSRGAAGHWVENGQISYPVSECTIAGNLNDMLLSLVAANDARAYVSWRVPSLLVEGMKIAGK